METYSEDALGTDGWNERRRTVPGAALRLRVGPARRGRRDGRRPAQAVRPALLPRRRLHPDQRRRVRAQPAARPVRNDAAQGGRPGAPPEAAQRQGLRSPSDRFRHSLRKERSRRA